jgi:hypothetical protein
MATSHIFETRPQHIQQAEFAPLSYDLRFSIVGFRFFIVRLILGIFAPINKSEFLPSVRCPTQEGGNYAKVR